jgi:hypothetical protein
MSTLGALPPPATQLSVHARFTGGGTCEIQDTVIFAGGGLNTGGVISCTVMNCVSRLAFPQESVAVHILNNTLGQEFPLLVVTAGGVFPNRLLQLSTHGLVEVGGTCDIHCTVIFGGSPVEKIGGVLSLIRIFWIMLAVFPHISVMR